jgi:hypothetical protein
MLTKGASIMGDYPKSIDISDNADLLRLAEEIRDGCETIILRRGGERLAAIVPLEPRSRRSEKSPEKSREALRALVGMWPDEYADAFQEANRKSRDASMGRPVNL